MKIRFTDSFNKEYRKLCLQNPKLEKSINKQIKIFSQNPKTNSAHLHKINFKDKVWSISINKSLRILLIINGDEAALYHLGKHEDVY